MPLCCPRRELMTIKVSTRQALSLGAALILVSISTGCSSRMETPASIKDGMSGPIAGSADKNSSGNQAGSQAGEVPGSQAGAQIQVDPHIEMAAEEDVAKGCLSAWRKACAGNEKESMAELEALDKRYPKFLTIQMMMGQVLDHFGKGEAAIEHYRKAAVGNEYSSLNQFKLANAYRRAHRYEEAEPIFRKLLNGTPDFAPALVGLADCLAQKPANQAEALKMAQRALELSPQDKDAEALVKRLAKQ